MTNVNKGALTSESKSAKPASTRGSADRIKAELKADAADRGVRYTGNADHLFLVPPQQTYTPDGRPGRYDPGVFIDFQGIGVTRSYFPDKNKADADYVKRVDEQIAEKHPSVVELGIRKLEGIEPAPPVARWNQLSVSALKGFVEANLSDDHDSNVAYVKACAAFELTRTVEGPEGDPIPAPRDEVLAMLDGLLVTEAALSSAFDAEVVLSS